MGSRISSFWFCLWRCYTLVMGTAGSASPFLVSKTISSKWYDYQIEELLEKKVIKDNKNFRKVEYVSKYIDERTTFFLQKFLLFFSLYKRASFFFPRKTRFYFFRRSNIFFRAKRRFANRKLSFLFFSFKTFYKFFYKKFNLWRITGRRY